MSQSRGFEMENRVATASSHPQLSAEAAVQLQEGIQLLLSRWSALSMAIDNEWGGPHSRQKRSQLELDIFSWLTQSLSKEPLYIDDLEDMLDEFMLSLNTEIADGSIEEIAEKLMTMHEECLEGNFNSIRRLKEINPPAVAIPHVRQAANDDTDDDDDGNLGEDDSSEMVVEASELQSNRNLTDMMVDEPHINKAPEADDGWTIVVSRRNRGSRRN